MLAGSVGRREPEVDLSAPSPARVLSRPDDRPLADLGRRIVTVSIVVLLFALAFASAPVWLLLAFGIDRAFRGRRAALRCACFLFWYLLCEVAGLLAILLVKPLQWLDGQAFEDANTRLQNAWARALATGARLTFGIRFEVGNAEVLSRGPLLLLLRHATVADTLIPTLAAAIPYGLRLRYVLKSELLWDPCLDIVGNRLGHTFARRGSGETDQEVARIARLAEGLGPMDGVLIYPEGTRFTEAKRDRILARLAEKARANAERSEGRDYGESDYGESESGEAERLQVAHRLRHVLPPKLEGTLGLLEAAPHADVVVCAHTGLEATTSFWQLWTGQAVDGVLRASCWRIPRAQIPTTRAGRIEWLEAQWLRVDEWIEANRLRVGGAGEESP
jgi:1-acyl-sn-glycerol-3-phosphate acyltransferase